METKPVSTIWNLKWLKALFCLPFPLSLCRTIYLRAKPTTKGSSQISCNCTWKKSGQSHLLLLLFLSSQENQTENIVFISRRGKILFLSSEKGRGATNKNGLPPQSDLAFLCLCALGYTEKKEKENSSGSILTNKSFCLPSLSFPGNQWMADQIPTTAGHRSLGALVDAEQCTK